MVNEELKTIFNKMSRREIAEVKTYLHQLFKTAREENIERYRFYVKMCEDVWGRKLEKSRKAENVWMRAFIADMMRKDGVSIFEISNCMGLNHSSVSNCLTKIKNMEDFPVMYRTEMRLYNEFKQKKYETIKNAI